MKQRRQRGAAGVGDGIGRTGKFAVRYFGQAHAAEHDGHQQGCYAHHHVWQGNAVLAIARKKEHAAGQRTKDAAEPIKRLRQVKTRGGGVVVAQFGNVGVGGCFEKHQTAGYDKKRKQEKTERHDLCTGPKQQGTNAVEQQTDNHTGSVTATVDEQTGGNGHDKIA